MKISVVLPIYNEEPAIPEMVAALSSALKNLGGGYEVVMVDDGSSDGTWKAILSEAERDQHIKAVRFSRNYGQTAALSAGIARAGGDVIVPIDADLENNPADIPLLIEKIREGYDVVSGWRKDRWGNQALTRRLPSLLANRLISRVSGLMLHDYGCTLKAYRREVLADMHLYGEMHRFIPAYAFWRGLNVAELPVSYRPRPYGKSNYGISRTGRVLLDLILLKFLTKYMNRPMHFFGGLGFASLFVGLSAGLAALVLRLLDVVHIVETPLPVFSALFIIVGVQLIAMGVIAEMLMRTYYESQGRAPYSIRETKNIS